METQFSIFCQKRAVNCRGQLLSLEQPIVMGIVNLTPDSFYDGGRYQNERAILSRCEAILTEGGTILDLGAVSSRPGSETVSEEKEMERLLPGVALVAKAFPEAIISVDTFRGAVAHRAVDAGAAIVNDISGGQFDPTLFKTLGKLKVPYVLMHIQGKPKDMQQNPRYTDVVDEVIQFFSKRVAELRQLGVSDIVLDPGFGFGKTVEHNYQLLQRLDELRVFDLPVLVGVSRKSMINRVLDTKPAEALNGTSVVHGLALQSGAAILRTHDVKEAVEAIKIHNYMQNLPA